MAGTLVGVGAGAGAGAALFLRSQRAVPAPINAAKATARTQTIIGGPLFVGADGGARTTVDDAIADLGPRWLMCAADVG